MDQAKVPNRVADFVPGPALGETARFFGLVTNTQALLHKPVAVRATRRSNQLLRITPPLQMGSRVNRPKDNTRKSKVNTRRRLE